MDSKSTLRQLSKGFHPRRINCPLFLPINMPIDLLNSSVRTWKLTMNFASQGRRYLTLLYRERRQLPHPPRAWLRRKAKRTLLRQFKWIVSIGCYLLLEFSIPAPNWEKVRSRRKYLTLRVTQSGSVKYGHSAIVISVSKHYWARGRIAQCLPLVLRIDFHWDEGRIFGLRLLDGLEYIFQWVSMFSWSSIDWGLWDIARTWGPLVWAADKY